MFKTKQIRSIEELEELYYDRAFFKGWLEGIQFKIALAVLLTMIFTYISTFNLMKYGFIH